MVGVTRAAISIALRKQRITAEADGTIDPRRPENAAYLATSKRQRRRAGASPGESKQQRSAPSSPRPPRTPFDGSEGPAGGGPPEIKGETYTMAELRDKIAAANLKEQKLQVERGELVTRSEVKLVFARMYQVHASQLKTLAEKLGPDVAAALGIEHDTLRVQELMDLEVRRSLSQIKKELNDYLDAIGDGTVEDEA